MVRDAWLVYQDEVVVGQFSQDPCNSSAKPLWVPIVLQVCMVSVDCELVGQRQENVSPGSQSPNDCKKFSVMDVIVSFCRR